MLDAHQYIMVADWLNQCEPGIDSYVRYIQEHFVEEVSFGQSKVPTFCGEWSLFNEKGGMREKSAEERRVFYRTLADAHKTAFEENCEGWFYWCYKTHLDDPDWDCWDISKCIANQWMTF